MDGAGPNPSRRPTRPWAPVFTALLLLLFLFASSGASALEPTPTDWPQFRGWDTRVGTSPSTIPATNETLWDLWLPDLTQSSFAVVDGKALVGCDDGKLYCFDALSGDELWTVEFTNVVQSSPTVADGFVYIGVSDGLLLCLDLDDGSEVWNYSTQAIVGSAAVWNGTVYVADQWGELYAVDTVTGTLDWNATYPLDVWSTPTVVDGRLYLGDIAGTFRCYDATTGDLEWENFIGGAEFYSTPCVLGGRVLVGTGLYETLECWDAETGDTIWTFLAAGEVYSSVAVSQNIVYVHTWPRLWAIPWDDPDDSGEILWTEAYWAFTTHDGQGGSSPVVAGDRLVVGSDVGSLFCLEIATGSEVWNVTAPGFVYSSPAVADGKVYIGWTSGYVACIGQPEKPRLYTTLTPTTTDVEGGQSITVDVTVLDAAGLPAADAFMAYSASDGTLSATFGTVVEGKFRVSWTAPDISSITTVTITATGELLGWDIVPAELVINVEPAAEAPPPEVPTIAHPGLLTGVIAFVVIDVALAITIVRGRRRSLGVTP